MIRAFAQTLPGSPRNPRTLRRLSRKKEKASMSPIVVLTRHQLNSAILVIAGFAFIVGMLSEFVALVLSGKLSG